MINHRGYMEHIVNRRIAGMILLFTFIAIPLSAQTDPPDEGARPESPLPPTSLEDPSFQDPPRIDTINSSRRRRPFQTGAAVDDSLRLSKKDSTRRINVDEMDHSAQRAMFYSLALPGLGQAYNKKYFKIPFVYGALGGVSYWVYYNTQGYRTASERYTEDQSDINERYLRLWRRNLELSYITLAGAYALQVVDAYVDAHLFYWDVSPELTLRVEPAIRPHLVPVGGPVTNYGLKCSLTF